MQCFIETDHKINGIFFLFHHSYGNKKAGLESPAAVDIETEINRLT